MLEAVQKQYIRGKKGMSKWMQGVSQDIKEKGTKGSFSRAAKRAGKTTREYAEEKKNAKGKIGKRARLALVFMNANHNR